MVLLMIFVMEILMCDYTRLQIAQVTRYGPVNLRCWTVILMTFIHWMLVASNGIHMASRLFKIDDAPLLGRRRAIVLMLRLLHVHLWPHNLLLVAVVLRMRDELS